MVLMQDLSVACEKNADRRKNFMRYIDQRMFKCYIIDEKNADNRKKYLEVTRCTRDYNIWIN